MSIRRGKPTCLPVRVGVIVMRHADVLQGSILGVNRWNVVRRGDTWVAPYECDVCWAISGSGYLFNVTPMTSAAS
ncbi:hypothetical protein [Gimesia aquarii]|uniref:hypothetical protein n=1 Tax=Gimesia aquarii TaxID=2527964 RepID=UPI0011A0F556|nr:hypothetical protein [Gimesia aquarii]